MSGGWAGPAREPDVRWRDYSKGRFPVSRQRRAGRFDSPGGPALYSCNYNDDLRSTQHETGGMVEGFNWIDAALLALVAGVAWGATGRGFLQVVTGLGSFVLALLVALLFTAPLAGWLGVYLALPELWRA